MTRIPLALLLVFALTTSVGAAGRMGEFKAGAVSVALVADDAMVIGGSIGPGKALGQEGELRCSAVVLEDDHHTRVALVACDVLMLERDILDSAARRIEKSVAIPFDNILINATHTHHAPTTVTIHGYHREEAFTHQVEDRIVEAVEAAAKSLKPVEFLYRLGEESSVGRNSRLLLSDGTIYWTGPRDDAVRPTGPFDPELPVAAFRRLGGGFEAVLFNHSTHTIGSIKPGVRSPSFYGLAAQNLERKHGGVFLFFEGASGSTHNLDVPVAEAQTRVEHAVERALVALSPRRSTRLRTAREEISVRVRRFDEAKENAAVVAYCRARIKDPTTVNKTVGIFREMRKALAPKQGTERKTWVQAITIGDLAIVGVPGEFFTTLGEEIKRGSPFRDTAVFELAGDYVGYIPDKEAFDKGGYQVWTGLHSFVERGTGELIVEHAIKLLEGLARQSAAETKDAADGDLRNTPTSG